MANLTKCEKCGLRLIFEESQDHICKDVLDYKIEDSILWLFDGDIWYPRKLLSRQKSGQPRGNKSNINHKGNRTFLIFEESSVKEN